MRLPSIQQIADEAFRTVRRFPFALLSALAGVISAIILVERDAPENPSILYPILVVSGLGISLMIMLTIVAERHRFPVAKSMVLHVLGISALVLYALTLPWDLPNAPEIHLTRFFLFMVGTHLLVAWTPFASRSATQNVFWQFNKSLFLRAFSTALNVAALYAGLAVALAALENLFGVDVPGKRYFQLFVLIGGLFSTWFYLAGVPDDLVALDQREEYPKGLKIFSQYILLPLVIVYFVILYAYLVKIVVTWAWPEGWVTGLILGFSTVGIFSFLLLHPTRDLAGNLWLKRAIRWFYVSLLPLVAMLFLAVWRRVSEYGMTEERYFALAIGVWLACIAVYMSTGVSRSIKIIPASLAVFAFAISAGPWSAFHISERSQVQRLRGLLEKESILIAGSIRPATAKLPQTSIREISAILSYLHDGHGYEGIQQWFSQPLVSGDASAQSKRLDPSEMAKILGIEFDNSWRRSAGDMFSYTVDEAATLDIEGFQKLVNLDAEVRETKEFSDTAVTIRFAGAWDSSITVRPVSPSAGVDSVRIDMRPIIDSLVRQFGLVRAGDISPSKLSFDAECPGLRVRIVFQRLSLRKDESGVKANGYDAVLLYAIRNDQSGLRVENPNPR